MSSSWWSFKSISFLFFLFFLIFLILLILLFFPFFILFLILFFILILCLLLLQHLSPSGSIHIFPLREFLRIYWVYLRLRIEQWVVPVQFLIQIQVFNSRKSFNGQESDALYVLVLHSSEVWVDYLWEVDLRYWCIQLYNWCCWLWSEYWGHQGILIWWLWRWLFVLRKCLWNS